MTLAATNPTHLVQWAHLAAFASALVCLGPIGCSNGGGDKEQGPSVSPVLDDSRAVSATIGVDGGVVQATGSDGTEYTLTVPADALLEDTQITLTPILEIPDLPMSGGFVGGAHFEPSGLELFRTATLQVTLPSAPDLGSDARLAGFVYDDDGKNLALTIAEAEGDSFSLPVLHFSGGGAGSATPSNLKEAFAAGGADAYVAELLEGLSNLDFPAIDSSLRRWYEQRIKPALQAAVSSDQALASALGEYRRWLTAESSLGSFADLEDLVPESQALAAAALSDAIARANDLCERQQSFQEAEKALLWQRRAESVLPLDVLLANDLDRGLVQRDLCVQVLFESTSFPEAPVVSEPALLRVVVGYAFGDDPIEFAGGMAVYVLATGAAPAGTTTTTDGTGLVELTLTPDGAQVEIEVDACIGIVPGAGTLVGSSICQEAFIVRGLVVSPVTVTLAPGGSQQFMAQLLGVDEEVTWSATGGTIDGNGLFTAGTTAGVFTVTATSIANPSLVATASVTIEVASGEPVTTLFLGTAQCFDIDRLGAAKPSGIRAIRTGSQLEIHFPRVVPDSADPPYSTPCIGDDWVFQGSISGDTFSGSTGDCSRGPCPISGTLSGNTITGRATWQADCECYTDFEATVTDKCVDLGTRLACQP
jgi:hypothetical protein